MVLICPSKTDGNSRLTSNVGTGSLAVATARCGGVIVGGGGGLGSARVEWSVPWQPSRIVVSP